MKKIVTLALALALVLSLCTVAFAATQTYDVYDEDGKAVATDTEVTYVKADEDNQNIAYYTFKSVKAVKCAQKDADYVVKYEGKDTVYLYLKEAVVDYDDMEAAKYEGFKAYTNLGTKCGQFDYKDAGYDKDDEFYTAVYDEDDTVLFVVVDDGKGAWDVLVNGEVLSMDVVDELDDVVNEHVWELNSETMVAKCTKCSATAQMYEKFTEVPSGVETEVIGGFWVVKVAATATGTGVDSSKTFDAGVAMYVGLSLASVAGSAVVIGKKKEF